MAQRNTLRISLEDAKLLSPPAKGKEVFTDTPFEHKAAIQTVPQGLYLQPVRTGKR